MAPEVKLVWEYPQPEIGLWMETWESEHFEILVTYMTNPDKEPTFMVTARSKKMELDCPELHVRGSEYWIEMGDAFLRLDDSLNIGSSVDRLIDRLNELVGIARFLKTEWKIPETGEQ